MNISKIPHPLLSAPGTSQDQRLPPMLDPNNIHIDDRNIADLLGLIYRFAGQVNYYNNKMELGDWRVFFDKNIPILLARIHQFNTDELEKGFDQLSSILKDNPTNSQITLLFDFLWQELILPINDLQARFNEANPLLDNELSRLISDNLQIPVKTFIGLSNGANKWYCSGKRDFFVLVNNPAWGLDIPDLFIVNEDFRNAPGGIDARMDALKNALADTATPFFQIFRELSSRAPEYIERELQALSEEQSSNYNPHLGLLFAFLLIFKHIQDEFNTLTTRHLEYYYEKILGFTPMAVKPDHAHIIFALQKHVPGSYLLEKGTNLKNGKDLNKQDVLYRLNEGIVLDKTQVAEVRTLYLNPIVGYDDIKKVKRNFVEGVYMAIAADKADGFEKDLVPEQSWPTLGDRESKCYPVAVPPVIETQPYPQARIGFVLASPVLLLNEGQRIITITLTLNVQGIECIETPDFGARISEIKDALSRQMYYLKKSGIHDALKEGLTESGKLTIENKLGKNDFFWQDPASVGADFSDGDDANVIEKLFELITALKITLSGTDDWIMVSPDQISLDFPAVVLPQFDIKITIELSPEIPAVTFPDTEKLKEDFNTNMPLVKIELDDTIKVFCDSDLYKPACCLEQCCPKKENEVSLYHYLRHLILTDVCIEAKVCGLKNLIVQNEENLQDVNSLILPFGVRPKLNAEFYIGSKEIFCKNWRQIRINTIWKDKPDDLSIYYEDYDVNPPIDNNSFQFISAVLDEEIWQYHAPNLAAQPDEHNLFDDKNTFDVPGVDNLLCIQQWNDPITEPDSYFYEFDRSNFPSLDTYEPGELTLNALLPLTVDTRKGFIKLVLQNSDFLHDLYAFTLAQAMIKLSGGIDPIAIDAFKENIEIARDIRTVIENKINDICNFHLDLLIQHVENAITTLNNNIAPLGIIQNLSNLRTAMLAVQLTPSPVDDAALITSILSPGGSLEIIQDQIGALLGAPVGLQHSLNNHLIPIRNLLEDVVAINLVPSPNYNARGIKQLLNNLQDVLGDIQDFADNNIGGDSLPNEPYTPTLKGLSIDYYAKSIIDDIELIHLHPYQNTHSVENIEADPHLLPTFVNEGHLFVGLSDLQPGNILNILFQLAEATANSELEKAHVQWHYLRNNSWEKLQEGFHLLSDASEGLTRSGIVKLNIPADINKVGNTIMPDNLHWIRASAFKNIAAIAETINVHTQAARVSYEANDKNNRESMISEAGSIASLTISDASIRSVDQFYSSIGGQKAEKGNQFYRRISERLRHKGRAISIFDYERIVLENFPEIFRAKCISHTLKLGAVNYKRDLELAPGFVELAVIPDIRRLTTSDQAEPRVPISLLNEIKKELGRRNTPFAQIQVSNPRYEKIHIELKVRLHEGRSPEFFSNKIEEEIRLYLRPWITGDMDALKFGRKLYKSDLIFFIETREYVDYLCSGCWRHQADIDNRTCSPFPKLDCDTEVVFPRTARSVLVAGKIEVTLLKRPCEENDPKGTPCDNNKYSMDCCEEDQLNHDIKPQIETI